MFKLNTVHAICLGHQPNVVSGGDSSQDWSLLLVISKTLACIVCAASLRNLDNNGRFDVPVGSDKITIMMRCQRWGVNNYRAASKTALAVEEEVTFCGVSRLGWFRSGYQDGLRLPKKEVNTRSQCAYTRLTGMANLVDWIIWAIVFRKREQPQTLCSFA